ncbi:hypothetical protein HMPREF9004_1084 [Schaalia cardiffensis F0333]|uniref:Uncharacterized protein n=1 Tax=Schaalia cardiffensis F0333 TaxID=888050 RepID=N6W6I6_9ACTO|nr:hypothetical protein HMPREF9004_1084 [Schaalia cardiffensis F0333]
MWPPLFTQRPGPSRTANPTPRPSFTLLCLSTPHLFPALAMLHAILLNPVKRMTGPLCSKHD